MARRIEKRYAAAIDLDVIRADMLGDSAMLLRGYVRAANGVEQGGLAVVDVAHDRHYRRARQQRSFLLFDLMLQLQGAVGIEGDIFYLMIELGRDQSRGIRVEHLVDGRHHTHAHQLFDDLTRLHAHFSGQVCHRDHFGNLNHPLTRPGNRDLGFADFFAGEHALFLGNPTAAQFFFSQLQHILLLDDSPFVSPGFRLLFTGCLFTLRLFSFRNARTRLSSWRARRSPHWRRRWFNSHGLLQINAAEDTRATRRFLRRRRESVNGCCFLGLGLKWASRCDRLGGFFSFFFRCWLN